MGRFIQPDTIVPNPGDPQALNRYSYTLNNPVRYTDSTGMFSEDEIMEYLGVTSWAEVLAMFGEGGAMAGVWGYLEAMREAQLGTPIKMWFDVSYGFNKNQPDMTGIFYEQNGDLMFAATFTNWSSAGGSWSVVGLSATAASQTLGAAAIYQVGSLGNYLDPNQQYGHWRYDLTKVDSTSIALGVWSATADLGFAIALGGAASGQPGLALAGAAYWMGGTAAGWVDLGTTVAQFQRGEASGTDLVVDVGTTLVGTIPVFGTPSDVLSLGYELQKGLQFGP